jgi:hypothetical protein
VDREESEIGASYLTSSIRTRARSLVSAYLWTIMDRKQKQQGKRKVGEPTIDQFHSILQQLCPKNQTVEFTEKAMAGLRLNKSLPL